MLCRCRPRPTTSHSLEELVNEAGLPHSPDAARLVLAVIDGALFRALAEGAPISSASEPLQDLLRWLAGQ